LNQLKTEMTLAENGHLIAFIVLQLFIVILAFMKIEQWQIISYTILNIILICIWFFFSSLIRGESIEF